MVDATISLAWMRDLTRLAAPASSRPNRRSHGIAHLVPRFTEESKQRVIAAADMVDVTPADAAPQGRLRHTGRCPFHEERTPSFSVNAVDKLYYCFGRGAGGDLIKFVRETEQLDFAGAVEWLAERFRVQLEYEEMSPRLEASRKRRERLHGVLDQAAAFYERHLWETEAARAGARVPPVARARRGGLPRVPARPLTRHGPRAEGTAEGLHAGRRPCRPRRTLEGTTTSRAG